MMMMGMECECSCEFDSAEFYPDFLREPIRRAALPHRCCECRGVIEPGDHYEYVVGKWEGEFSTFATCLACARIRRDYCACGYTYGGLREAIWECLGVDLDTGEIRED